MNNIYTHQIQAYTYMIFLRYKNKDLLHEFNPSCPDEKIATAWLHV